MKKLSIFIFSLVFISSIQAQNKICKYEYWLDDDYAGRIAANITPVANLHLQTNLSLAPFSVGFHILNIRFKDSKGLWSGVATQYIMKYPPGNSTSNSISGYEYWVDDDYSGKVVQIVSAGQNFHLSDHLAMAGFSTGFHMLNIRFKDSKGIWSDVLTQYFQKIPVTNVESNDIYTYRFWFDNDLSSTETITLTQPQRYIHLVDSIEIPFLPVGDHLFNYQFKDSLRAFSSARADTFNVVSCLPHGGRAIAGSAAVCAGRSGVVYTIHKIKNATGYVWSVPAGAEIISGNNSWSVTVDYSMTAVSGNVSVYATNGCGSGPVMSYPVIVHQLPDPVITGENSACIGTSGVYHTESGKSDYTWSVSPGNSITYGGTSTSPTATVVWNSPGPQWIRVNYTDIYGCRDTTDTQFNVIVHAAPDPVITGPAAACKNTTQTYSTQTGMNIYQWEVSVGGTIIGNQAESSITVSWNSGGPQWVKVNYADVNGCNAINPAILPVMVDLFPTAAGTVIGPSQVAQGQTGVAYSVASIPNASGYSWSLPPGASVTAGANTGNILVDFGNDALSGGIRVQGSNSCGNGTASQVLFVRVIPSSVSLQNITIFSGQLSCNSAAQTIYVAGNGTAFAVEGGGSATMIAGQNILYRPTTTVDWGGYMHGYITTTSQYCGTQPPAMVAVVAGEEESLPAADGDSFRMYPNPTTGSFTLEFKEQSSDDMIHVVIYSMHGENLSTLELPGGQSHVFSLSDKPAGLYIIHVLTGRTAETAKIIKQ
jgi:hypothetical protein